MLYTHIAYKRLNQNIDIDWLDSGEIHDGYDD